MNGSTFHKRWITVNFLLTTDFSANFETWTPWKRTIQIIKNYWAADWTLKKHYPKGSFPNYRLQEKKTTNICLIYGINRIWAHLKTFYAGRTTKTLSQHSNQCKNRLLFTTRTELTCWSSGVHFRICRIFLHKSTSTKFYPFTQTDKDLLQKIREDMVRGPPIVFTRKAVVKKTFIRNSGNICKSIVCIDASQLYPFSMCQPMPTGLYTRCENDTESKRFEPQQNKSRNFENMIMSHFQRQRPGCKIESFYTTETQKKTDCFKVDGFGAHCNTVFEAMGCFYH